MEGYDMAKNSFLEEKIFKHTSKPKKSRPLGYEDKSATLSEWGKNA